MIRHLRLALLALGCAVATSGIAHATLITNGDFEINGGNGSDAADWTKEGAYGIYNEGGARNGPFDGSWAYVPGNGGNTTVGVYQTLATPLTAGEYTLSFYSNPWANDGTGNDVRVGLYGGDGTHDDDANYTSLALSVIDVPTVNYGVWELRSYTFTATGGEDTVYFGTAVAGNNNGADIDVVSLVAITLATPGDINGDGVVDRADVAEFVANYSSTASSFGTGDFDGDSKTGLSDLAILQANLDGGIESPAAAQSVPEPTTSVLLLMALFGLAARRWRGRR